MTSWNKRAYLERKICKRKFIFESSSRFLTGVNIINQYIIHQIARAPHDWHIMGVFNTCILRVCLRCIQNIKLVFFIIVYDKHV